MLIGHRKFNDKDQSLFCEISGDFNPLHSSPLEARKTIAGRQVVHGIHTFLWVLDLLVKNKKSIFQTYNIKFLKPVFLEEPVFCYWDEVKSLLTLKNYNEITLLSMRCKTPIQKPLVDVKLSIEKEILKLDHPKNTKIDDLSQGDIFNDFCIGDIAQLCILFADLSKVLGEYRIFEITRLSSIIGMQIPGLHSIFSECIIGLDENKIIPSCHIQKVEKRFNQVYLSYQGRNLHANLIAFFRPKPIKPESYEKIIEMVNLNINLENLTVLIIGGSRGLGAWTAKLLAAIGANIIITYNSGKLEATELVNEINKKSFGKAKSIQLDVNKFNIDQIKEPIDHLYYFATPKIFGKQSDQFDAKIFQGFKEIYADKFFEISKSLINNGLTKILYPSSVAIDEPISSLEEYIQAKILGEKQCIRLEKKFQINVFKPRIERVLTDQTATILPVKSKDPFEVSMYLIHQMLEIEKNE